MELLLIFLLSAITLTVLLGSMFCCGCFMLAYGRYYYDRSEYDGRRNWPTFRRHRYWDIVKQYFGGVLMHYTDGKPPDNQPVLYCVHPHGLMALTTIFAFGVHGSNRDGKTAIAGTRILLWMPIIRDLFLWLGGIDCSREHIEHALLDQKRSVVLLPGGVREMVGTDAVYDKHEGFLRLAIKHDIPLIPIYARGEAAAVKTWCPLPRLREWCLDNVGYPFPTIFWGPFPVNLQPQVGPMIQPSQYEDLATLKAHYYATLKGLK